MERLRSQVARLEYENAKLKVDLQNRSVPLIISTLNFVLHKLEHVKCEYMH